MNRLKENDCIVSRHVIQIKLSYFSSNNIYTKIIERDKYSNKDKRFNFPISSLNNCNFRFTHFRSFKIQFKRFEIQDSDHENFHLKKKKKKQLFITDITQSIKVFLMETVFRSILRDKGREGNVPKNGEDSVKNKM